MKFTKRPPDVAMKNAQFFRWIPPDLGPKWLQVWPSTVTLKDPEKGELDIVSDGGWRDLVVPCHQLWDVDPNRINPACAERASQSLMVWIFKIRSGILMEMTRQGTICDNVYRPGFFSLHLTTLPETNIPPEKIGVGRWVSFGGCPTVAYRCKSLLCQSPNRPRHQRNKSNTTLACHRWATRASFVPHSCTAGCF